MRALRVPAFVALLSLVATLLPAFAGSALATSTWTVCASGCNYTTISAAVNAPTTMTGDTIEVSAGSYTAPGGLNKGVTLRGPNAGISPNTGTRVPEAVILGGAPAIGISTTELVTIDGFAFSGQTGLIMYAYTSGNNLTITNNIFADGIDGFFLFESQQFQFEDNYLHDLADCGGCEGIFHSGNWDGVSGTVVTIKNNVWEDIGGVGMNLSSVSGEISGNRFSHVAYYAALLANATNVDVTGNTFDNITNPNPAGSQTWGAGIRFYTPAPGFGARITGNTFTDNYNGIGVRAGADITGMDVYAHQNVFMGNGSAIRHEGSGTLDATCNWYGSATGPANAGNPGGTGDPVLGPGPTTFAPWLTALDGDCIGGTPKGDKQVVIGELTSLIGVGSTKADKRIQKAIDALEKSLTPAWWDGDSALDPKHGNKVFDEEKKAVHELTEKYAADVPAVADQVEAIVQIDRALAAYAIANPADPDDVDRANEELAKGDAKYAQRKFEEAIEHYKHAWEKVAK